MTKEIQLPGGKVALVDDEDFEEMSKYEWYEGDDGHVVRAMWQDNRWGKVYMAEQIMGLKNIYPLEYIYPV